MIRKAAVRDCRKWTAYERFPLAPFTIAPVVAATITWFIRGMPILLRSSYGFVAAPFILLPVVVTSISMEAAECSWTWIVEQADRAMLATLNERGIRSFRASVSMTLLRSELPSTYLLCMSSQTLCRGISHIFMHALRYLSPVCPFKYAKTSILSLLFAYQSVFYAPRSESVPWAAR